MRRAWFYETQFGRFGIAEREGALTHIFFRDTVAPKDYVEERTALLDRTAEELRAYFAGKRRAFDLPLAPEGTPFQLEEWKALAQIPYGERRTYRQLAEELGRPKAYRAVGRANALNPISIILPCHRVLGADGSLTGYAGGLEMKRRLLEMEERVCLGTWKLNQKKCSGNT